MKAILEFDLNDPDDRREHKLCVNAQEMSFVLFKIAYVWKATKHMDNLSDDFLKGFDLAIEGIRDAMEDLDNSIFDQ